MLLRILKLDEVEGIAATTLVAADTTSKDLNHPTQRFDNLKIGGGSAGSAASESSWRYAGGQQTQMPAPKKLAKIRHFEKFEGGQRDLTHGEERAARENISASLRCLPSRPQPYTRSCSTKAVISCHTRRNSQEKRHQSNATSLFAYLKSIRLCLPMEGERKGLLARKHRHTQQESSTLLISLAKESDLNSLLKSTERLHTGDNL